MLPPGWIGGGRREVIDDVLHPGEVGVTRRRYAILPTLVVTQPLAAPVGDVERRIGENEIGLEIRMAIVVERGRCPDSC